MFHHAPKAVYQFLVTEAVPKQRVPEFSGTLRKFATTNERSPQSRSLCQILYHGKVCYIGALPIFSTNIQVKSTHLPQVGYLY